MKPAVPTSVDLDYWHWLSLRVRCALEPDEPRVIDHYLAEGRYLGRFTPTPSRLIASASLNVLLDTACDRALPWAWRCLCLDQAYRPLRDLRSAARGAEQIREWHRFAYRLAHCQLLPSLPLYDPSTD